MSADKPLFSVVIPARGRLPLLLDVAGALAAQLLPGEEIIVVCDGAPCPSRAALPPAARCIEGEGRGIARARNLGAECARQPYLLFWGADIMPAAGALARHRTFHAGINSPAAILMGNVVFAPGGATTADTALPYLRGGARVAPLPLEYFLAAHTSISRSLFSRAGGFCGEWGKWGWEEYEFAQRLREAGAVLYFDVRALGWHIHSLTLEEEKRRNLEGGYQMALADALHPNNLLLPSAFPFYRKVWLALLPWTLLALLERWCFVLRRVTGIAAWKKWKERREAKEIFCGVRKALFEHDNCAGGKLWKLNKEAEGGEMRPKLSSTGV